MTMNRAHEIGREMGLSQEERKKLAKLVAEYVVWMECMEAEEREKVLKAIVQYIKEDIEQR